MSQYKYKGWITPIKYCDGKPCYDKRTAQTAQNKRYKDDHVQLRIYHCNKCDHWHLTHRRLWESKKFSRGFKYKK